MNSILLCMEGIRMLRRARRVRKHGFTRFPGDAGKICREIVRRCFNGRYFQTSLGHFAEFYIRDFALCVPSLLKLGYHKEVCSTLQYALSVYSANNTLSTTITPEGRPLHVYSYSPDSLPLLLRSIRAAGAVDLLKAYRPFINASLRHYYEEVFDRRTGLVRKDRSFSSMKDHSRRPSSCYDNSMLCLLADELAQLGINSPLNKDKIRKRIRLRFWNGCFFKDDLSGSAEHVSGDAQVFPFWCGAIDDRRLLSSSIRAVTSSGLDRPWPLKYSSKKAGHGQVFPLGLILPDYEKDCIWMHLGLCYLDVIREHDEKLLKRHIQAYTRIIEEHGTFLELFEPDGSLFIRPHYATDEGMLWAAKYLELSERL